MKTGIEVIAAVKVEPRTEPLKGGATMARIPYEKHTLKGSCRWVYIERGMSDTLHGTLLRAKLSI